MADIPARITWDKGTPPLDQFQAIEVEGKRFYACGCVAYSESDLGVPTGGFHILSATTGRQWPKGQVPYRFDTSFSQDEMTTCEQACALWHDGLCLRADNQPYVHFFEDVSHTAHTYFLFTRSTTGSNNASTGFQQGHVSIIEWGAGTIAHELGHILGLIHEHQRSDRDSFVTIDPAVASNPNFRKHGPGEDVNRSTYDFDSIMHYPSEVELNGQDLPAIHPVSNDPTLVDRMGQRDKPSPLDIAGVQAAYGLPVGVG